MTQPSDPTPPSQVPPTVTTTGSVTPPVAPVFTSPVTDPPAPAPTPAAVPAYDKWTITPGEIQKFLVAVIGVIGVAVTQGLIEGAAAKWVAIGISLLTAAGVYVVPNKLPSG